MGIKFNAVFWGVVGAQLALLLVLAGVKEYTLRTGAEVILQTVPVDPRSILQGDYVVLRYRIETLPPYLQHLNRGDRVYVTLTQAGEIWEDREYTTQQPDPDEVFIKGTVSEPGRLDFRIGTYFVPEGSGHIIEGATDIKVKVALDGDGDAVIKQILVNGEPFNPDRPEPTPGALLPQPAQ